MAYPDYSIVIISVTTGGVTTDYASAFYNEQLAQKFYDKAISEGKRAFYFEKPTPSKFVRNDAQPLKVNTELGAENNPVSLETATEQKVGEVAEVIRRYTAPVMIADAFGFQKEFDQAIYDAGVKTYEIWKNTNNFYRRLLLGTTYTLYGTPIVTLTITNKRIQFLADGNGEFIVPPTITKLWPNKDEIEDGSPAPVYFELEGQSVLAGSRKTRKTFKGNSAQDFDLEFISTYEPEGTILLETDYKIYKSDGNGWVTSENKEQPPVDPNDPDGDDDDDENNPCPSAGTEVDRQWIQDSVYPIVTDTGLETSVVTGGQYSVTTVNDLCGYDVNVEYVYSPSGTVLYETDANWYKSSGDGSVYSEAKEEEDEEEDEDDDESEENDNNDEPECQQAGEFIRTDDVEGSVITSQWSAGSSTGSYQSSIQKRDITTDGYCGENEGSERTEYIDENIILEVVQQGEFIYVVYTTSNGGWAYAESWSGEDSEDTSTVDSDVPDGNFEYPAAGDCPPANYGDKTTTSVFKSTPNGDIVGILRDRKVIVPLPTGNINGQVYTTSISTGAGMPPSSLEFYTGMQYFGRFLADGTCGWLPETPNVPETWRFPNVCKPAGYYTTNKAINPTNPQVWVFSEFKENKNNQKVYVPYRCYIYHDGQGNVSIIPIS